MSISPRVTQPPRENWLRSNVLTISIVGVLLVGGGVGLAFNHTSTPTTEMSVVPGDPATDMVLPASAVSEVLPAPTLVRSATTKLSFEDVTPPDNPFIPTAPLPAEMTAPVLPATGAAAVAAAKKAAPAAVPVAEDPLVSADDLALTGVIDGDPPLAVVRYEGQSLFLKIGEKVADTWRLVEIKERSAIFQLGAQRVEVPIKGGSSE